MRRILWPPQSDTYKFNVAGSTDTPCGPLNIAVVPCPSAHPASPLPASVLTFQKQGGCALSPATAHAVAGAHAAQAAGALAYVPTGHVDAVNAQEVAPAELKDPAAQGRHAAEELAPGDGE